MRKIGLALLLLFGGCVTQHPAIPVRYQVGIPVASGASIPAAVLLRSDLSDGNVYTISVFAITNNTSIDNSDPAYTDIATNRWPARRFHLDLSLDGGSNWPYRIGYGVQFDPARINCDFIWSPPPDYRLLTTNAVLRAYTLDGSQWPQRTPRRPYDIPEGKYPVSFPFTIGGAIILTPVEGAICWQGSGTTITWMQQAAGPVMNLYWLTPTSQGVDVSHWLTTISNCVDGVTNSKVVSLNVPISDELKLVLVSAADPRLHGYSQSFTVDP